MAANTLAKQTQQHTVQVLPDANNPTGDPLNMFYSAFSRAGLLSEWGTRQREKELRLWSRHERNWMGQGASAGVAKRFVSTPWEIKGPPTLAANAEKFYSIGLRAFGRSEPNSNRPDIEYWQELLRQAQFGAGWSTFGKMLV